MNIIEYILLSLLRPLGSAEFYIAVEKMLMGLLVSWHDCLDK